MNHPELTLAASLVSSISRSPSASALEKPFSWVPGEPERPEDLALLGLTPRENDVLFWLLQAKSNGEIASLLSMTTATAKKHLEHIFAKLGVENRTAAALSARQRLWIAQNNYNG